MRIVFEVAGDKQLDREILRVGDRAIDASPAFAVIADLWIDETRQQFDSEGQHGSGGWAPLAPATIMRRRKHGSGPIRILHDTGRLQRSLTERGNKDMILEVSPTELTYGSRVPYAEFHQTGTGRMPRRRPVEFTERARVETVKILQRFILTGEPV